MKKKLAALAALTAAGAGAAFLAYKRNPEKVKRLGYDAANAAIFGVLNPVVSLLPDWDIPPLSKLKSESFFEGHKKFLTEPADGAHWRLGYANASLLGNLEIGSDCYIAGFLHFPPNRVTGILDDQKIRAVCLSDGSGRGSVVFAVIDCVGISNTDVRAIRSLLADFAEENNIIGINISATHCHSGVDTQGLWGDLKGALAKNSRAVKNGNRSECLSGRNPEFMANLHSVAAETIKAAFSDMRAGILKRCVIDELDYSHDKRPPDVVVKDLLKLRFIPDDGSRETNAVFMAAHPVCVGYNNSEISSDYIYYIEESMNEAGSNCIFFQGAQLAVATARGALAEKGLAEDGSYQEYGRAIGKYVVSVSPEREEEIEPVLNLAMSEISVPCTNPLLIAAGKLGIVNNRIARFDNKPKEFCFISEIGYAELGKSSALALIPGELAPEILLGGAFDATNSYNHTDWNYPTLTEIAGKYLTVIGLCNDSVGYILPENDFGSVVAPLHYEEAVSAGPKNAETIIGAFEKLVNSRK